ncbi:uncharacterized protein PAC_03325 [Phialocephala subalpina]|uniref:Uncharacterized protein n=1 Tax=Phialocephala subalpina TaxID=576137 RepID=A0A1L7WL00_9HELO|nr:uncharacterized protein PAC_03325 [Phialocephala subalpina]
MDRQPTTRNQLRENNYQKQGYSRSGLAPASNYASSTNEVLAGALKSVVSLPAQQNLVSVTSAVPSWISPYLHLGPHQTLHYLPVTHIHQSDLSTSTILRSSGPKTAHRNSNHGRLCSGTCLMRTCHQLGDANKKDFSNFRFIHTSDIAIPAPYWTFRILSLTSHSLLHQIDSNSEKLEYLSSSSESVLSLSVANSHRLEELSDGLDESKEFFAPRVGLPSEAISDQEKDIEPLPTSLTVEEQNLIVSNVENRLSECAYDFVAKYQLPIPALPRQRKVRYPMDREWAEWAYPLKRLTLKHCIPEQILGNRRLESFPDILEKSVHQGHQGAQTWPTRHQQSLPQNLDDWYILQIISSGIRVAQFLKDSAAMEHLVQLYRVTMDRTQRFNTVKDNLISEGSIDFADGIDSEDSIDSAEFAAEIFHFLLSLGKRRIEEVDIESLGRWPNKRDRINNWLLESLLCSNVAATLHRSILTGYDII